MRRRLFADAQTEPGLRKAIGNLLLQGNSLGIPAERRAAWTDDLGFAIPDARTTPVEYLWFVGDYASTHPRVIAATRAAARVLRRAHVDFGILYDGEKNAGNDVRRAGAECMFELMERNNLQVLAGAHFANIVTTDPHSYNVLKNEYTWNGYRPAVLHLSELLERLLTAGKLPVRGEPARPVTYQDPCYLGRYNGIYDAPRHVLEKLGFPVLELPGNHASAWCCGSGGGRIWMSDFAVDEPSPSVRRIREAARIREVSRLVVACPKDLAIFSEAVKVAGLEHRLEVRDLAEVADEVFSAAPVPA
jgi:Fe-S oxidoreductase